MLKSMSRPLARCVADDLPDLTAIEADILQFAVVVLVERIERGLALAIGQHLGNPAVDARDATERAAEAAFCQTGLGKSVCHVEGKGGRRGEGGGGEGGGRREGGGEGGGGRGGGGGGGGEGRREKGEEEGERADFQVCPL